jgi:hypothetical protein
MSDGRWQGGALAVPVAGQPGERAIGAREGDDRTMIRTLVNMLVWNLVGVLAVVAVLS